MDLRRIAVVAMTVMSTAGVALADSRTDRQLDEISKQLKDLANGQAELKKEIQDLKTQINTRPAPQPMTAARPQANVAVTSPIETLNNLPYTMLDDRTTGSKDARVVVLEFSDFQCGFCANYHKNAFPSVMNEYVATGKVRYGFRDFPIPSHKDELKFAQVARCADEKGRFWAAHDYFFTKLGSLNSDNVTSQMATLGLDAAELGACAAKGDKMAGISRDGSDGLRFGIRGTPAIVIGIVDKDKSVKMVRLVRGAKPFAVFKTAIDEALKLADEKTVAAK
ncbi:MAG: DsbA family protein [Candidatus Sumerlaeaceae bacterium]|nr:DsbA family protein [Candidatus Sumerlaeaceae bacterium]